MRSSIKVNTVMVALKKILKAGLYFDFKKEKAYAEEYVKKLHTATSSVNKRVMFLSGGNQQKVVLAKWLLSDADIIILDEPTRGIDVGAKREIMHEGVISGEVLKESFSQSTIGQLSVGG